MEKYNRLLNLEKPNIGDFCDAQDKYNKWFAGRIVGCDGEFKYLIKFNSWSRIHNEWIDIRSRHIMPLYSITKIEKLPLKLVLKLNFLEIIKNHKEYLVVDLGLLVLF